MDKLKNMCQNNVTKSMIHGQNDKIRNFSETKIVGDVFHGTSVGVYVCVGFYGGDCSSRSTAALTSPKVAMRA